MAVGFAISCFGLLLFLWLAFGGPVPLKSKSYRVEVPFQEATQLAVESDVRISGVSVGKVKGIQLSDTGNYADATIQIDPQYAPIPANTKAILRQKTLLGETYVELTPGDPSKGMLPEDGSLPAAQVGKAVQLDEIFRTFTPETRLAFQNWMQSASEAVKGRGVDLNAALGNLSPFAQSADDLLQILDSQDVAVKQLIKQGGTTFNAISERPDQLRSLIQNTDSVFGTIADRDQQLIQTFQVLPTFLDESKATLSRLQTFANDTNPLITQLRPSARELSGTLQATAKAAPDLTRFSNGLVVVNKRAQKGLSSLRKVLDDQLPPPLARIDGYMNDLLPLVQALGRYKGETTALLGNLANATNATNVDANGNTRHYIRATNPFNIEELAAFPHRPKSNRTNAYVKAGDYTKLAQGLDSFLTEQCTSGIDNLTLKEGAPGDLPAGFFDNLKHYIFNDTDNSSNILAPQCTLQPKSKSIGGSSTQRTIYPHIKAEPGN